MDLTRLRTGAEIDIGHESLVHIDIETRSKVNLPKEGVYRYAADPSTEIIVVRYVFGESEHVGEWWPYTGQPMPSDLEDYFLESELLLGAHNAAFERLLFNLCAVPKYEVPPTQIERWYCTAYQMLVNNLPKSLEDAGTALRTNIQKDKRGKELIRMLSLPTPEGTFREDPDLMTEFSAYCKQDVLTERAISKATRLVSVDELRDYWASEHVNDVGIRINRQLAERAVSLTAEIAVEAEEMIKRLTDGAVLKPRGKILTDWTYERLPVNLQHLMVKKEKVGPGEFEEKVTLDRGARERLLEEPAIPPLVREVVEVADSVGSGSVAKYQAMLDVAEDDDRVRGSYTCSGAAATGRYSAQKLQVHNFSRDCYKDPLPIVDEFLATGKLPDSPMLALKRLLRATLIASRGKTFVCGDWSAIEGCALPWLTQDERCQVKLDLLHNKQDIYLYTATDLYDEQVTDKSDPRRQVGKVAELALGYGGGAGSFIVMAANYGVYLEDHEVQKVIFKWRQANPGIVQYWDTLEQAALRAIFNPMEQQPAGRVTFLYHPQMLGGVLWCRLPNGRLLTYNHIRVGYDEWDRPQITSLNSSVRKKTSEDEWPRRKLYGGLLSENVTQAVCGDLLRECIRALVQDNHPVVLHTHDEVMLEVPVKYALEYKAILEDYMLFRPEWAEGLPLNAELWTGNYYRK